MTDQIRPRFYRIGDVQKVTGLKPSTIYAYTKAGVFPKPIPLGGCAKGWVVAEVEQWCDEQISKARASGPVILRGAA